VYALTWFTLALMLAGAAAYAGREEWRLRAARFSRPSRTV
jgi:cytochrome oxidase assembly protein ShyY1